MATITTTIELSDGTSYSHPVTLEDASAEAVLEWMASEYSAEADGQPPSQQVSVERAVGQVIKGWLKSYQALQVELAIKGLG